MSYLAQFKTEYWKTTTFYLKLFKPTAISVVQNFQVQLNAYEETAINMSRLFTFFFLAVLIVSCSNNGRGELEINWGIVGLLSFIAFGYFLSKKERRAEDETRNLNEQVRNQRGNPLTQKLVFNYSKIKFTHEITFKPIQIATAEVYKDRFEITIYPYSAYSGTYVIVKSQKQGDGILNTVVKVDGGNFSQYNSQKPCFVHISERANILKIYDENRIGIILKF